MFDYYRLCVVLSRYLLWCICMLLYHCFRCDFFFFFKQKTAYEMRISDWSSDVCSSDLAVLVLQPLVALDALLGVVLGFAFLPDDLRAADAAARIHQQIGRASCRERVCQYV